MIVLTSISLLLLITSPPLTSAAVTCSHDGQFIPHETDCTKYYHCVGITPTLESCSDSLWFNPNIDACDWPDVAFCNPGGVTTTKDPSGTTPRPTPPPVVCVGNVPEFSPHPTDCNLYYVCVDSVAILEFCPPNLWWHPEISACDWPDVAFCNPDGGNPTTTSAPGTPGVGPPMPCPSVDIPDEHVRYPHATDCTLYYLCVSGSTQLYKCATSGHHFSPQHRTCQNETVAGCDRCPSFEVTGETVRLPHESVCKYYYLCAQGQPIDYQCTQGHEFSWFTRSCQLEADAYCNLPNQE